MTKILGLIALGLFSTTAMATNYVQTCHSDDLTVTKNATLFGPGENKLSYSVLENGTLREVVVNSSKVRAVTDDLNRKVIWHFEGKNCANLPSRAEGQGFSIFITRTGITLSNVDGSTFPKGTVHVSSDQKTISTEILCQIRNEFEVDCPTK